LAWASSDSHHPSRAPPAVAALHPPHPPHRYPVFGSAVLRHGDIPAAQSCSIMPRSRSHSPRDKRRERSRSGDRHRDRRERERERSRDRGRDKGRDKSDLDSRHFDKKKDKIKSICGYTNDDNPFGDSELTKKFVWKKKDDLASSHSSKGERKSDVDRKQEAELRIVELKRRREEREAERAMIEDMRWQARPQPRTPLLTTHTVPSHIITHNRISYYNITSHIVAYNRIAVP